MIVGRNCLVAINGVVYHAKIDTGAYNSSICETIYRDLSLPPVASRSIKNVAGCYDRLVVECELAFVVRTCKIYPSVSDRRAMKFPVLIGRKDLLKFGALVDVSITGVR